MALISFYNPAEKYSVVNKIWLGLLLIFPVVLWILPASFFDGGVSTCPSKLFFNVECFGCGITRAIMHLHNFDFNEAIYYNTSVVFVYPLLVAVWFYWVWAAIRRIRRRNALPGAGNKPGNV